MTFKRVLVTGGAGFIGSAFIRHGLAHMTGCERIVNLDALTYAANLENLAPVKNDPRYFFVHADVRDEKGVEEVIVEHGIDTIVHFAAESHVDRSISGPRAFYDTNVGGTIALLEVIKRHPHVHMHHISTDEVFGSLGACGKFSEASAYQPNSPYSASKAAADHFVRAYSRTFGLSTTISYCSNNYGPCQHVEKFIPQLIAGCRQKTPLAIYGSGLHVRDWIFVDDHVSAVWMILAKKQAGECYGIGGECELPNLQLAERVVQAFALLQNDDPAIYRRLITHVADRPGHDERYAIDAAKIKNTLGWSPRMDIQTGLSTTIEWYLKQ